MERVDDLSSSEVSFTDGFLGALGAWQRGWREHQERRLKLAATLEQEAAGLAVRFRQVTSVCYRKRFLMIGDLTQVVLGDGLAEGITSWTTRIEFAEMFKDIVRDGTITGAVFAHKPTPAEVVVNIEVLWACEAFRLAVERFHANGGENSGALLNFRDSQGEVVLNAPIRGSEIVRLSGLPSGFDELCNQAKIHEDKREALWKKLFDLGMDPTAPRYSDAAGSQRAIQRTLEKLLAKIRELDETRSR
jgi:hypothetical protein